MENNYIFVCNHEIECDAPYTYWRYGSYTEIYNHDGSLKEIVPDESEPSYCVCCGCGAVAELMKVKPEIKEGNKVVKKEFCKQELLL